MNSDLSDTEINSDHFSQTSFEEDFYPLHTDCFLHYPQSSYQILLKKPKQNLNQRCTLLLRTLIIEQMSHKFDNVIFLDQKSSCGQFKFFLNTMEILFHYLHIIKLDNYSYRNEDYGIYKDHLTGFSQKLSTGNIITIQTYSATLRNEISDIIKASICSLNKKKASHQRIIASYNQYTYFSAQYHLRLKAIFKELSRLGIILNNICKGWRNDTKSNNLFFIEGLWDPTKKMFYVSQIKEMFESFERSVRDFEQSMIKCTIALVDLNNEERKTNHQNKLSYSVHKTEGDICQYYSTPTENLILRKKLLYTDNNNFSQSTSAIRLLSQPTPCNKSPKFGKTISYLQLSGTPRDHQKSYFYSKHQKPPGSSSSKLQSTQPTTAKAPNKGHKKTEVEVQPFMDASKKGVKNFSFLQAVSDKVKITKDSYSEVYDRFNKSAQTYSSSIEIKDLSSKPKESVSSKIKSAYQTPISQGSVTPKPAYLGKENYGDVLNRNSRKNDRESFKKEEKNDQLKSLFQQSNFIRGKLGGSSRLLKFK